MMNKKFTLAAVAAAAIAVAPLTTPAFGAVAPVLAATTTTSTSVAVSGSVSAKADSTIYYKSSNLTNSNILYALNKQAFTVTAKVTLGNGSVYYVTSKGAYLPATGFDASKVTVNSTTSNQVPATGTVTIKANNTRVFDNANVTASQSKFASKGDVFTVVAKKTLGNGSVYYISDKGQYLSGKTVDASKVVVEKDTTENIGIGTINYNKHYGIQIWTKDGKMVKFNAVDAKAWNENHPKTQVKVGDPKKLPGQTQWKLFNATYKANGTTYYNLGGDQYIDAHYVIMK